MAHIEQFDYVYSVRERFPSNFYRAKVLEIGSLDINGTIREFFDKCAYIGVDLNFGPGVDFISRGSNLEFGPIFDTVCSCECFEHDSEWDKTFLNMIRMTKPKGLVFFTCATIGRQEHGTKNNEPESSPFTNDYYRNLSEEDFLPLIGNHFSEYKFSVDYGSQDLQFYGVKK